MQAETEAEIMRNWPQRSPSITLQPTKIPYNELTKKILVSLEAGDAPDVTYTHQDWIATFAQRKIVRSLDDLVRQDRDVKLPEYFPAAVDYRRWGGKLYGLTWILEGTSLIYNRDLLAKAGLADPRGAGQTRSVDLDRLAQHLTRLSQGDDGAAHVGLEPGHDGEDVRLRGRHLGLRRAAVRQHGHATDAAHRQVARGDRVAGGALQAAGNGRGRPRRDGPDARTADERLASRLHAWQPAAHLRLRPAGTVGARDESGVAQRAASAPGGLLGHGLVQLTKKEAPAWELVKYLSLRGNRIAMAKNVATPLWPAVAESKEWGALMRPWEDQATYLQLGKQIRVMVPPPGWPRTARSTAGRGTRRSTP